MTIVEAVKAAKNILIIGHQRPDGDCIGAGLALRRVCLRHGKHCDFVFDSPVPAHFSFLDDFSALGDNASGSYDLVVCVDCADNFRAGKFQSYIAKANDSWNIDHHKSNNRFARNNIVVPDASSTCEVLFDLLNPSGEIDDETAALLYMGLSTDTGHFMHSNTNAHVFEVATELARHAINPNEIARNLYKNTTYEKVKLIAKAIDSIRFFADEKICVITVLQKDLSECGCVLADTEGLIDYGMMLATVEVAICISEQNGTMYKVSYRSKKTDVAQAAAVFGGGGHKLAAGCTVHGIYEDVLRKVVKSVTDGMDL